MRHYGNTSHINNINHKRVIRLKFRGRVAGGKGGRR